MPDTLASPPPPPITDSVGTQDSPFKMSPPPPPGITPTPSLPAPPTEAGIRETPTKKERIWGTLGRFVNAGSGVDFENTSLGKVITQHQEARLDQAKFHYNQLAHIASVLHTGINPQTGAPLSPDEQQEMQNLYAAEWEAFEKLAGVNKQAKAGTGKMKILLDHIIRMKRGGATDRTSAPTSGGGEGNGTPAGQPPPPPSLGMAADVDPRSVTGEIIKQRGQDQRDWVEYSVQRPDGMSEIHMYNPMTKEDRTLNTTNAPAKYADVRVGEDGNLYGVSSTTGKLEQINTAPGGPKFPVSRGSETTPHEAVFDGYKWQYDPDGKLPGPHDKTGKWARLGTAKGDEVGAGSVDALVYAIASGQANMPTGKFGAQVAQRAKELKVDLPPVGSTQDATKLRQQKMTISTTYNEVKDLPNHLDSQGKVSQRIADAADKVFGGNAYRQELNRRQSHWYSGVTGFSYNKTEAQQIVDLIKRQLDSLNEEPSGTPSAGPPPPPGRSSTASSAVPPGW